MAIAKVFWSGRSQAVRLPREFRFDSAEVSVRRYGSGIILEPVADDWTWLDGVVGPVDEDFAAAAEETAPEQDRTGLDLLG
jgi:antitoxin VapB